jgi:predicted dithiol-disulfide oxidoreductase (DUF899 family)
MTHESIPHPRIVSQDIWLAERMQHLQHEKELTRQRDRVAAERRRLPMVRIEKPYTFDAPAGKRSLLDLFEGRRQLVVYHFMFAPEWEDGCPSCTFYVDALGDLTFLGERDTKMVLISRAPLARIETYKAKRGWDLPWVSSFESDFNYDFHVSLDESITPIVYNYRSMAEHAQTDSPLPGNGKPFERQGLSVFFRLDDEVFHTYSTYARGLEPLTDVNALLDSTPYGRQEDWEDSPNGWPQVPA